MKDYYEILGITKEATQREIRNAYRRLVVLYHPDKNPDPAAQEKIRDINLAYDVLGDEEKRRAYDLRFVTAWTEMIREEPVTPRHRDPRYRRKPPGYRPPPKPTQHDLMVNYLPYTIYICYAGLLLTSLLFVDRILPFKVTQEEILLVYSTHSARNHDKMYDVITTSWGKKIIVYNGEAERFLTETELKVITTRLFAIPMEVVGITTHETLELAYIYRNFIFFPLFLFVTSLLAVILRKKVEFSFNMSIVNAIVLILNLYFIFH